MNVKPFLLIRIFFIALVVLFSSTKTFSRSNNYSDDRWYYKLIGVDLQDIIQYVPLKLNRSISYLKRKIESDPTQFFLQNKDNHLRLLTFQELPKQRKNYYILHFMGLFEGINNHLSFQKLKIKYYTRHNKISILHREYIPIEKTSLSLSVGLLARKLIIKDDAHDIRILFPLGVGGVDNAVIGNTVSLLTPAIKNGSLNRLTAESSRTEPYYFWGRPFLRIMQSYKGGVHYGTEFGFHIQQGSALKRAFISHGCLRMRGKDLDILHDFLIYGPQNQIPLSITYLTKEYLDHPYPKDDHSYKTVTNFGGPNNPQYRRSSPNRQKAEKKVVNEESENTSITSADHKIDEHNLAKTEIKKKTDKDKKSKSSLPALVLMNYVFAPPPISEMRLQNLQPSKKF